MSKPDRPSTSSRAIPRATGRPIGVGIQLPEVEREVRWPELRAIARLAEQAGFDSIWVGDHLLYRYANGRERAGRGRHGRRSRRSPRPPSASRSGRWSPRPRSTRRSCSPSRRRPSTRSPAAGWSWGSGRAGTTSSSRRSAPRSTTASRASRRRSRSSGRSSPRARSTSTAPTSRLATPSCCRGRPRPGGPLLLIGSSGPRMLAATAPVRRRVERVVRGHRQLADGRRAAARDRRRGRGRRRTRSGRDRAHRRRPRAHARRHGPDHGRHRSRSRPSRRSRARPTAIAEALRAYAREGIGHVQLVVDPITEASVAALAPALEALDRGERRADGMAGRASRRASHAIVRVLASAPTRASRLPPCRGSVHATTDPAAIPPFDETAR